MSSDQGEEIDWNKVMEKEAMGEGGLDLGTIKQVQDDYIVSEMGGLTKREYKLPKSLAKSFNGVFLNFSVNETDLSTYEIRSDSINSNDIPVKSLETVPEEEEVSVPLIGEDLNITKKIAQDNVKLIKEPIKETKTLPVELMHEKINIERREISSNGASFNTNAESGLTNSAPKSNTMDYTEHEYSKTEISIPIKREEPVITKRSFIREEVVVNKKPVTEAREITEEVTSERVSTEDSL
jgi:stress response protein YsnF